MRVVSGSVSRESVTERLDVLLYLEKPKNQRALVYFPAGAASQSFSFISLAAWRKSDSMVRTTSFGMKVFLVLAVLLMAARVAMAGDALVDPGGGPIPNKLL